MMSIYRWQGAVQEADEVILLLKTTADLFGMLEEKLRELHPYDCPCIVALPIALGSQPYLGWIRESVFCPADTASK